MTSKPADRLKEARIKAGFGSAASAARHVKMHYETYKKREGGEIRITLDDAFKFASAFNTTPFWLLRGEDGDHLPVATVPVHGEAAGGVWLEGEDVPIDDTTHIPVLPDARYSSGAQYARKVVGNSVSNRIRSGNFAIFVRFDAYRGRLEDGQLVDVQRLRAGLREHTVKVFRAGRLETDSAEMDEQEYLHFSNGEDDTEVTIVGVAIGAYKPLLPR